MMLLSYFITCVVVFIFYQLILFSQSNPYGAIYLVLTILFGIKLNQLITSLTKILNSRDEQRMNKYYYKRSLLFLMVIEVLMAYIGFINLEGKLMEAFSYSNVINAFECFYYIFIYQ